MATTPNEQFDDELLSAYLDGELDAATRAAVDERLRTDERARRLLTELRQASETVKALPPAKLGRDLRGSVLAAIEKASIEPATIPMRAGDDVANSSGRGWVWAGVAVAIAASIMVMAVFTLNVNRRMLAEMQQAKPEQVADDDNTSRQREVRPGESASSSAASERGGGDDVTEAEPTAEARIAAEGEAVPRVGASKTNDTGQAVIAAAAPGTARSDAATAEPSSAMIKNDLPPAPAAAVAPTDEAALDDILNVHVVDQNDAARFDQILAENQIEVSDALAPTDVTALLVEAVDDEPAVDAVLVEATPQQLAAIRLALAAPAGDAARYADGAAGGQQAQASVEGIRGRAWRLPRQEEAEGQAASLDSAASSGVGQGGEGEGGETRREGLVRALFLVKRPQ